MAKGPIGSMRRISTLHPRLVELRRALADYDMGRVTACLEAFVDG